MLNLIRTTRNIVSTALVNNSRHYSWQLTVQKSAALIGPLLKVVRLVAGKVTRSWVLAVLHFVRQLAPLVRKQGTKGAAKYLKACNILLMKFVAGDQLTDTALVGARVSRTLGGLPRIIPGWCRSLIRRNDPLMIRLWLTLFGLYRVMEFKAPLSFKTITDPGKSFDIAQYEEFSVHFVRWLTPFGIPDLLPSFNPRPITKSAPGTSGKSLLQTSFALFPRSARVLWADPILRDAYLQFTAVLGLDKWYTFAEQIALAEASTGRPISTFTLGKLGVKEEPGKMRVFAMVDWLTQMIMEPLHQWLFSILRHLPMDGTHDQGAAVAYAADLVEKGHRHVFSLDLSAATDRLPVSVQTVLLNQLVPGIGKSWETLLVGREYSYGKLRLRYAVGQPMGALSSWAMLAMTHHFLVQFAA
jgi:hypothetical protein